MPINYVYTGEPMTGSEEDDVFIAFKGSTGTDNNTVNANGGDDLVIGDSSDTWIPDSSYNNGSIANAFNLETLTSTWSTAENQMFGDWTIPHTTVVAVATVGQSEYYKVHVTAGQQIILDIDYGSGAIGTTRDLVVELQDSLGNIIKSADDSFVTDGGQGSAPTSPGSAYTSDPYLVYTVTTTGDYYINVRPFGGGPGSTFDENDTFLLNVSVGGHTVGATSPVQGTDIISGGAGNDALYGQGGNDTIDGGDGDDFIDSGSGGDIVHGGIGNDLIYGGEGTEENIHGDDGDDVLHSGGEGHYYGDGGNDLIYAGLTTGVNEVLDGGAGVDTLDTTSWNSSYVVDLAAGSTNFGEVFSNFENIVTGDGADAITGTAGDNVITTRGGNDTVSAGDGDDIVAGGTGGDSLDGGSGTDILDYRSSVGAVTVDLQLDSVGGGDAAGDTISGFEGAWGSSLGDILGGNAGNNELRGFGGNDTLNGGNGNDILDGGTGDDVMTGGIGNDTYYADSAGDVINEAAGQGTDTLYVGYDYTIAANSPFELFFAMEDVFGVDITGNSAANRITGNNLANTLTGGGGNDVLDGGEDVDRLVGGAGNDIYYVDNAGDQVIEADGGGTDTVYAAVTFSLAGQYVEVLRMTGTAAIGATGNGLANTIYGNVAANIINGGGGDDVMRGGKGDDTYYVDQAGDQVIENDGEGSDTVISTISYNMNGQYTEALILAGGSAINGTGNGLANKITGNGAANILVGGDGSDRLDGGGGTDTMKGGLGNDVFVVDNALDKIVENDGEGTDTVETTISYSLAGQYVEILKLMGSADLTGTGNGQANILYGNSGNNTLNGGAGADDMYGGTGNDTYVVDNLADRVFENNGEGTDTVQSSVSFAIGGQYVEIVTLTGTAAINATGNGQANTLNGNSAVNTLSGGGGDDQLHGGLGNDVLIGGAGLDQYWFETALGASNVDSISDFSVADDTIVLDRSVFSSLGYNGALLSGNFVNGTAALDANDYIVYDQATGKLYYDADGSGAGAKVQFAQVTAHTALTYADFLLVA